MGVSAPNAPIVVPALFVAHGKPRGRGFIIKSVLHWAYPSKGTILKVTNGGRDCALDSAMAVNGGCARSLRACTTW